jgi:hypothetical protein
VRAPRTLHEACQAAIAAGRCRVCGAFRHEPCCWADPGAGLPAGVHAARFGAACILGLLTAQDLTTVVLAAAGRYRGRETVIWDTGGQR